MTNQFRAKVLSGQKPFDGPSFDEKRAQSAIGDDLSSVRIARSEHRRGDHRDSDRHRLSDEMVRVVFGDEEHEARLVNLSGGGAMIEASAPRPHLNDKLYLLIEDGFEIECAVRWLRDDRIGLEFAHETRLGCAPDVRDSILLDTIRKSFPDLAPIEAVETPEDRRPILPTELTVPEDERAGRAERRHPLIWSGSIYFNHDSHRIRLRNISPSGALVENLDKSWFKEGHEVMLDLGAAGELFAKVRWVRGDQVGLAFDSPYDMARLAEARPQVASQQWERPTYFDREAIVASPWDDHWARSSVEQLREDLEGFMKR